MKLYDTQRSGNAWKVRLLAGFLNKSLQRVTLSIDRGNLGDPEFLKRSPLGMVPTLELDDGRTISESIAILQFLAHGTPWWPIAALDQAYVLMWLSFEQSQHMHPLAKLRLHLSLHRDRGVGDEDMVRFKDEAKRALHLLDDQLARQGSSGWVATQAHPSIADVALYPYTRLASMGGIDLGAFQNLSPWLSRMESLPGYQPLFPGRPELNFSTVEIEDKPK
ncbi:glutathione S-transferase [Bradyrhizobium sp. Rc3b]|uniref:glutathione S-transferase family protein n=1 Tax=Bradyrhizobium sp. Rc3b TaxID=1855322 RepID=UPI0008E3EE58|nr:glutathione S-transferase family protein [Bradyrhizobium sp. Rc3b]SFN83458.1 glutathione S-transferase [Bradyrhizobium sp. Rc3b]